MATTVATVYVNVLPSAKNFAKQLRGELNVSSMGKEITADLEGTVKKSGGGIGGVLAKGIKRTFTAVLGGGALFAGLASKGGLSRLLDIEDARASLSGLGHDAKAVDKIMNNALDSVRGTAFGMGDAAKVAASAVAAGVKPGEDLVRTLKLVGDTATIAKTDMGSMGAIFNKVASSDMMQMDVANQLMDAGIPILQLLSKELGVTTDQVRTMASAGEIDFATFQNAMESGLGGAALKSGDTTRGAFKNMMASVSRVGANFLGKIFPTFKQAFQGITSALEPMEGKAEQLGIALGEIIERHGPTFVSFLKAAGSALIETAQFAGKVVSVLWDYKGIVAGVVGVLVAYKVAATAARVATMLMTMWQWRAVIAVTAASKAQQALAASMLANPITWVVLALIALGAALVVAYKKSETFRNIVNAAWSGIKTAVALAWDGYIKPALTAFGQFITGTLWPIIQQLYTNVVKPIFAAIGTAISYWWTYYAKPIFAFFVSTIKNVIWPTLQFLGRIVQAIFQLIGLYITIAWRFIKPIFTAIGWTIRNVLGPAFSWLYNNIVKPVMGYVGSRISSVWNSNIKPAFNAIKSGVSLVADAFGAAKDRIASAWDKVKSLIKTPLKWAVDNAVNPFIGAINGFIPGPGPLSKVKVAGFATGGAVHGPGTATSDSIFAKLSRGEHVLTAADVKALGGHARIYAMRQAAKAGQFHLPGFANGGAVVPGRGRQHSRAQYPWATYAGDFPNPIGTPVRAWKAGVIALVKTMTTSYGKHIRMNHSDGTSSLYAHLSSFAARMGDQVRQGQIIGRVGSTGNSTGPHLHFEAMGGPYKGGPLVEEKSGLDFLGGFNIKDKISQFTAKLGGHGGLFGDAGLKGLFGSVAGKAWDWVKEKVGSLKDVAGSIGKSVGNLLRKASPFDSGGIASGVGLMPKATIKPERVLSPRQTVAFDSLVDFLVKGRQGPTGRVALTITNWDEGTGYMEAIAEERLDDREDFNTRVGAM